MRPFFPAILSVFCGLWIAACNGDDGATEPAVAVAFVSVTPDDTMLVPGGTLRLVALPRDAQGNPLIRTVTWSSLAASIAAVDSSGGVTALAPGDARIVATVEGISDTARVRVSEPAGACEANDPGNGQTMISGPTAPNSMQGDNDTMFRGFLVDPANPDLLYLGTERNGMTRSTDGGLTWTRLRKGLRWNDVGYAEVWSIARDPADPSRLFAATTDSPGPLAGSYPSANAGIYRSANAGQEWTRSNCGLTNAKTSFVLFVPGASNTLVASVQAGAPSFGSPPAPYYTGGLFRSTNGGAHWSRANAPAAADSMEYWQILARGSALITFAFRDADLSKNVGFLKSLDAGATWTPFAPAARAKRYYTWTASAKGDTLLAAERDGFTVDRSIDGGATWTALQMDPQAGTISHLAVSPADSRLVLYAGGSNTLVRSTDALATRALVLSPPETVQAIQFAPSQPSTVYAVTRGYRVYRSVDAGLTWTLRGHVRADVLNADP
jgi:hypothetical protein